jgi:hypothetical protein
MLIFWAAALFFILGFLLADIWVMAGNGPVSTALAAENREGWAGGRPEQNSISGLVQDEKGPLAGALVRVKGMAQAVLTDKDGTFTLSGLEAGQAVAVTAWAPGYYIGGGQPIQPGGEKMVITIKKHADDDNADYSWLPSFLKPGQGENQGCAECHSSKGTNLTFSLPVDEWQQDLHSQSAVNPRFLTMYEGSDRQGRRSDETRYFSIKDYGTFPLLPDPDRPYYGPGYRLDFPQTEGNCAACHTPAAAINAPTTTDPRGLSGVTAEGISCDFCHKIWEVKVDPATGLPRPNAPGVLSMEFRRPHQGHQFFAGPYDDVAPGEDTFSPLQRQSRFFAAGPFGIFWDTVIYNSYGEWLQSSYSQPGLGKTCQDCHMPPLGNACCARPDKGGLGRDPATVFSHRMPGAADAALLQNAVTLRLFASRDSGRVTARVTITNDKTGHHVPTDSPLRHMILLVSAVGAESRACALLDGPRLPSWCGSRATASGHYAGLPGRAYAKVLEETWTRVTPTGAYWNPTRVVSDNRLAAFASDSAAFVFQCRDEETVEVQARLLFRRAYIELMETKGWDFPDISMAEGRVSLRPLSLPLAEIKVGF